MMRRNVRFGASIVRLSVPSCHRVRVCMYVCVCVSEREREREREGVQELVCAF